MEYKYNTFFKLINTLVDFCVLNLSLAVAYFLISDEISFEVVNLFAMDILLINLLWFFSGTISKLYDRILNTDAIPLIKKTFLALLIFSLLPFIIVFLFRSLSISYHFCITFITLYVVLLLAWKILFLTVRKSQRRFWIDYKKIVILGAGQACHDLTRYFEKNRTSGYVVQGYFSDEPSKTLSSRYPYLGKLDSAVEYARCNGISEIFSALPSSKIQKVKELMKHADHNLIRFRLVPDIAAFIERDTFIEYYGALPVLSPRREPLEIKVNEVLKQIFDYTFASLTVLFVLSWVVPIVALAIKLDSRGPVFFRQLRSGKDNKPFFCLKFRSMKVNELSDIAQASKTDDRITRVGAILRKTSIDELPQFFTVLMGDMSIVGPRPHMLKHTEDYSQVINNFMVRHFVTPGITGWAQVNGLRGETTEPESMNKRVKADIWYLENWSLLLDLKIVFLTVWQSFKRNEKAF